MIKGESSRSMGHEVSGMGHVDSLYEDQGEVVRVDKLDVIGRNNSLGAHTMSAQTLSCVCGGSSIFDVFFASTEQGQLQPFANMLALS